MPKKRKGRVKLIKHSETDDFTRIPEKETHVTLSGFGELMGELMIGKIVGINKRAVLIELKDEDGTFIEYYHRQSGVRMSDLTDDVSGWKIDGDVVRNLRLYDAVDKPPPIVPEDNEPAKFVRFAIEETPYPSAEGEPVDTRIIEVWREETTMAHYLKAYRTGPVGDGALKSPKQFTCVIPFEVLRQVLYDFESNQD